MPCNIVVNGGSGNGGSGNERRRSLQQLAALAPATRALLQEGVTNVEFKIYAPEDQFPAIQANIEAAVANGQLSSLLEAEGLTLVPGSGMAQTPFAQAVLHMLTGADFHAPDLLLMSPSLQPDLPSHHMLLCSDVWGPILPSTPTATFACGRRHLSAGWPGS